jgi:hypothetical protein
MFQEYVTTYSFMTFIKFVSIIHSQEACMYTLLVLRMLEVPYILEYNLHPFYIFRGLKKSDVD